MDYYEVAICQKDEWDWQSAIYLGFDSLDEAINFIRLSLDQGLIVQIRQNEPDE